MFGALRQGSSIYVMDKQNKPILKIGTVVNATQPTGFNLMPYAPNMVGQTTDIKVQYDDGTTDEFKQMQTNQSVAVYGNVVVTETRELMLQEIDNMERTSKGVLDTIPYHQSVLASVDEMRVVLSPSFAKERRTDERLNVLEQGLGAISQAQNNIMEMLSKIAPNSSQKSNNNSKN